MFTLSYKYEKRDSSWVPLMVVKTISEAIEYMKARDFILDNIHKGDWYYMKGPAPLNQYHKVYPMPNMIPKDVKYIRIERLLDRGHEIDTANILDKCFEVVSEIIPSGELLDLLVLKILRGEIVHLTVDRGHISSLGLWFSELEKRFIKEIYPDYAHFLLPTNEYEEV